MRKIVYGVLTVLLLLTACGTAKERVVVKEKQLPAWYLKPPASDMHALYGVGEGRDKKEALSNALSSILATLSVSISSQYSAKSVIKEGHINSQDATYVNETQSEVKKIRISNYQIVQSAVLGFKKYAVLVKVDRVKFFKSLRQELDQDFTELEIWEQKKKGTVLQKLAFYNRVANKMADLKNRLTVMSVLNDSFDPKPYLQKYETLLSRRDQLLKNITFWVVADYRALAAPIEKGLSEKKFRIKRVNNHSHFTVFIKSSMQQAKSYGFYIVRSEIRLETKDAYGTQIAANILHITGNSSQSFSIAKQDVVKKLNQLVVQKGVAKILNLNI